MTAAHPIASGTAAVNGTTLFYERHGVGPSLVLIEGLGVATWIWDDQIPAFAPHFHVIAYDNRGMGHSATPPGPYSIATFAEDLLALLDHLAIERTHLLGVSMGGYIAIEFAIRWPERVDRLVLAATGPGGSVQIPMSPATREQLLATHGTPRDIIRAKLPLAFSESWLAQADIEAMIDLRLKQPQPRHAFQAQAAAGAAFDRAADLHRITAPTLVLAAEADRVVPPENGDYLAARIPDSRLIRYPDLGHQFWVEDPAAFNRDVLAFLRGAEPDPTPSRTPEPPV